MKLYELTYLIEPGIDEKELETLSEKIKSFIIEKGGILGKETAAIKKNWVLKLKRSQWLILKTWIFN